MTRGMDFKRPPKTADKSKREIHLLQKAFIYELSVSQYWYLTKETVYVLCLYCTLIQTLPRLHLHEFKELSEIEQSQIYRRNS